MTNELPEHTRAQVAALPEFRMGVHRVGVRLTNGSQVDDVLVSSGRVTRVLGFDHVSLDGSDVVAIVDQGMRPLPAE